MVKRMQIKERIDEREHSSERIQSFRWTRAFDSPSPIDPELLGNKGKSLAEMIKLGLPVPPGFTLTTDAWKCYKETSALSKEIWQETLDQMRILEAKTGKVFGDRENPLIVSVRSGALYSMPAMMETILNVGINDETLTGLAERIGVEAARGAQERLKETFITLTERELPQDVYEQLRLSIEAIFSSWDNPRAVVYRQHMGISHSLGTAATVQEIVFGNINDGKSGSGVFFTRNPYTGKNELWGEFALGTQGIEVVSGKAKAEIISSHPLHALIQHHTEKLERHFRHPQDVEFTVEKGNVWFLQTRNVKLPAVAHIITAHDMWQEGILTEEEAFQRITQEHIKVLFSLSFNHEAEEKARKHNLVTHGKCASPGIAEGYLVTTPAKLKEYSKAEKPAIFISDFFDPNDIEIVFSAKGIITRIGGTASHMALMMQANGIPGIVSCEGITVIPGDGIAANGVRLQEGDRISMNATTGDVYAGWLPKDPRLVIPQNVMKFLEERKKHVGDSVWSSALYPVEAPYRREDFMKKIKDVIVPEIAKWNSPKIIETIALNRLLPHEEIIQAKILSPDDLAGITREIRKVYGRKKYEAIPRSIHTRENLGKEPWTNVPLKNIHEFLYNRDYIGNPTHPEYGGLPKWKENPNLVGIIVPAEPKGKLDRRFYNRHFAFTIKCIDATPARILIDISMDSPHLREIEEIQPEKMIEISVLLNSEMPYSLGNRTFDFGRDHFDKRHVRKLIRVFTGKREDNPVLLQIGKRMKEYFTSEKIHTAMNTAGMVKILAEMIKKGILTDEQCQCIVKKRSWLVTELVVDTVFQKWWQPPTGLPHVMSALNDVCGFSVIEAQGRMEKDGRIPWKPKIYGLKGAQELTSVMDKLLNESK